MQRDALGERGDLKEDLANIAYMSLAVPPPALYFPRLCFLRREDGREMADERRETRRHEEEEEEEVAKVAQHAVRYKTPRRQIMDILPERRDYYLRMTAISFAVMCTAA